MIKSGFSYLKLTAVVAVLGMTVIAGVLLAHGHANPPQDKFSVKDATTRENNGKRITAKRGFELVKDGNNVSARRLNKPTERSKDHFACGCSVGPNGAGTAGTCSVDSHSVCGGSSCDTCAWVYITEP